MSDLTQVTFFFEDILQESKLFDSDGTNEFPDELTTDNGTDFFFLPAPLWCKRVSR